MVDAITSVVLLHIISNEGVPMLMMAMNICYHINI